MTDENHGYRGQVSYHRILTIPHAHWDCFLNAAGLNAAGIIGEAGEGCPFLVRHGVSIIAGSHIQLVSMKTFP